MYPRITEVSVPAPFQVALDFSDGAHGVVDLGTWIAGRGGVFLPLHEASFFAKVMVDPEAGTLVWPNGVDLDPDMLYEAANNIHNQQRA